ncbi:MAG: glucuronate isomerase [bacterium]
MTQVECSKFAGRSFMLGSAQAKKLYFQYADQQPIIDFHSHLSPAHIAQDHRFRNMTELWIDGDHYKWRLMRACGIEERFITGNAPDRDKFLAFALCLPLAPRNPIYHWTHMELRRPFGIKDWLLGPETAPALWDEMNDILQQPYFSCRGLIRQFNVEVLCTTDDPADDLRFHDQLRRDKSFPVCVLPTFRADNALGTDHPGMYNKWIDCLSSASGIKIISFDTMVEALRQRRDHFHSVGCRLADQSLPFAYAADYRQADIAQAFSRIRSGKSLSQAAGLKLKSAVLHQLGLMYHELGWVMHLHLGALRNNNTRRHRTLGRDAGCDSIGDLPQAHSLARFLDRLNARDQLPKTVIYNLNPSDNELMAAMAGNFQDDGTTGKIQYGSAWWFMDQYDGIRRHLETLSNFGALGTFIGMVTDSRSFLCFSRHEYFRRILCDFLGRDMAAGLIPDDMELVGSLVRRICAENARAYFKFPKPAESQDSF